MLYMSILGVPCLHLAKQTAPFETVKGDCRAFGQTLVKHWSNIGQTNSQIFYLSSSLGGFHFVRQVYFV